MTEKRRTLSNPLSKKGITIGTMTVIIKSRSIQSYYPGGLCGFDAQWPYAQKFNGLRGLCFMSGQDIGEFLAQMKAWAIIVGRDIATGELFSGVTDPCPGIQFQKARRRHYPKFFAVSCKNEPAK